MSRRHVLLGWLALVVAVTLPWTSFRDHAHWSRVVWIPFGSGISRPFDVVANIVLYLPLGWVWSTGTCRSCLRQVLGAAVSGLVLSIGIEWAQVYSHGRFPSATDVACNTLGAVLGVVVTRAGGREGPDHQRTRASASRAARYSEAMSVEEQVALLTKGCVDVVRLDQLRARVQHSIESGTPLVVKVGFDPTAPDLHLGHTVVIRKMRHFQQLGHTVVFVIGDFTGMIGDPTGRSKTRPPLSRSDIERNAETYREQVFKLLDPDKTLVEFNSRWLSALGSDGLIRLAARYNVAQMLERREFRQRFDAGQPIAIHEFLYPLAQAYDSVALKADVELGGTDQLWNLNVGRDIMPAYDLPPQIVMTTPLLEGLDGVEKMSKSLGNYVGITESPGEMYGKLMSISDDLMWRYYLLLTDLSPEEIERRHREVAGGTLHPKRAKGDLAARIVADFHSPERAAHAAAEFERVHARGELPSDMTVVAVSFEGEASRGLTRVMCDARLAASASDAGRKVQQGGVRLNGQRVSDPRTRVNADDLPGILQVGRHAVRLVAQD